jgi:hypothetical protein
MLAMSIAMVWYSAEMGVDAVRYGWVGGWLFEYLLVCLCVLCVCVCVCKWCSARANIHTARVKLGHWVSCV